MAPPPPVRLTTGTGTPRDFDMPSARWRAVTSAALPAPNITVISTGLPAGNCWATAAIDTITNAAPAAAPTVRAIIRIRSLHHGSLKIRSRCQC